MTFQFKKISFKKIFKSLFCAIVYPIAKRNMTYSIMDSDSTIEFIITNHVSISRFGDGEYYIINNKFSGFQKNDEKLKIRLKEILSKPIPNHLICLPYSFISLKKYRSSTRQIWRNFIVMNYKVVNATTSKSYVYGDSLFSRFYMILKDKSNALKQVEKIKKIWEKKNVCIVEGCFTRFGSNNDLLNNCHVVKRILCPPIDAFSIYDDIMKTIINNISPDTIVLCALGMTATVLSYDLAKIGYMAIDIGHLDIEYEWAKMNADEKCPIPGKSVNEAGYNIPSERDITLYGDNIINISGF